MRSTLLILLDGIITFIVRACPWIAGAYFVLVTGLVVGAEVVETAKSPAPLLYFLAMFVMAVACVVKGVWAWVYGAPLVKGRKERLCKHA